EDRAGGDLRAGDGDHHLQGSRRGDPYRQQYRLRPRRVRVDPRYQQGDEDRHARPGRIGVGEYLWEDVPIDRDGGVQAVRPGPPVRAGRPLRVYGTETCEYSNREVAGADVLHHLADGYIVSGR